VTSLSELLRHAARRLRRSPGYAVPVVVSLALGIGLNTAIFAVIQDVLRRPLPYPDESQLVTAGYRTLRGGSPRADDFPSVTWSLYGHDLEAWREGSRTLESMAVFSSWHMVAAGPAGPEFLEGGTGSSNLLNVLRARTALGRWFATDETNANVVVLSHDFWQRQFAGDPKAIGRTVSVRGEPSTVIGVMPPGVGLPLNAEFWVPSQGMFGEQLVARPRPGVSLTEISRELTTLSPTVARVRERGRVEEVVVRSLREQLFGSARPALRLLTAAAALLLLIACANIANLSLARTLERKRELAVRLTLGASRKSLVSLVVAENFLLAVAGAVLGFMLAALGTRAIAAFGPDDIGRIRDVGVGMNAVLFAGVVAVAAGLLVSVAPVLAATDRGVQPLLSESGARATRGRASRRARYALVATQLAVALLLITGAGLLIRSVQRLTRPDHLGFSANGVVIASVPLFGSEYRIEGRRARLYQQFGDRVRALPGVTAVGFGPPPLVGGRGESLREGFNMIFSHADSTGGERSSTTVFVKHIDAEYLDTYRIRLRAGRAFQPSDDSTGQRVAILSATAARRFFHDRDAIGQSLTLRVFTRGGQQAPVVVGVVDDVLQRDLTMEANPEVFLPLAQQPSIDGLPTVAVRTASATAPLIVALRQVLRDIDPQLAASRLEPMQAIIDASLERHAFLLLLLAVFAGLGLALSAIGLYAVISYLVTQRTLEIGIRMALGAQRHNVFGLVLREGALLTITGLAIGIAAALALSRLLAGFLFDVQPHDATTFVVAPTALAIVALLATMVPARRAAGVDPARAMKAE
jgi:putative ABC transport system permease protein